MKQAVIISWGLRLITWGFIAGAAGLLALITWQLYLPPGLPPAVNSEAFATDSRLTTPPFAHGLFGTGAAAARVDAQSDTLAATRLPVTLTGLLASDDVKRRLAVVQYQGKQASYREGDTLPVSGVRVARIERDGIVLDEPGGLTHLGWPRQAKGAASGRVSGEVRTQLVQRPQDIADFLSVAPVREGDVLRGYRINPGRKPELFNKLGFEPNDLAVAINGNDLSDSQQAQQILLQLPQLRALTVTVERDGQRHDIAVSLDEGAL